jgi:hypothetical protein
MMGTPCVLTGIIKRQAKMTSSTSGDCNLRHMARLSVCIELPPGTFSAGPLRDIDIDTAAAGLAKQKAAGKA